MTDALRQQLLALYGIPADCEIRPDARGMINRTLFIGDDKVLTIFENRPPEQVALIAEIVKSDNSGFLPPLIEGASGPVSTIEGKPAVMWQRLGGNHFVRPDHSDKVPILEAGHASIAQAFWRLHQTLAPFKDKADILGRVYYFPAPELGEPPIEFTELPDFLQTGPIAGFIVEYLQASELPLKYPALVHHDMERQNFLHDESGVVTGIVDADSFKQGDLLYEYCRCMMNFMFSDPDYKPAYADHYMREMVNSGMIDAEDVKLIPGLIRTFIAKDLLDYCRYESDPPKTNLSRLTVIYDSCLKRVDEYFSGLSLPELMKTNGPSGYLPSASLSKQDGPK